MCPGPAPGVRGGRGSAQDGLGATLRTQTRDAHLAAERAFDLPRRLRSLGEYADGLLVMEAFQRGSAPVLAALAPLLPGELRRGPERRRARLHADLAALHRPLPSAAHRPVAPPETFDPDRALGAWYVHEGAALGGLMIAAEVRRHLPGAAGATRYFSGEGRGTAARWRTFQNVLAAWEQRGAATADGVVAGARDAFAALLGLLDGPPATLSDAIVSERR